MTKVAATPIYDNKSFLLKGMFACVYHISIYTFRELKNNKIYFED